MIISSSNIQMKSMASLDITYTKEEHLKKWIDNTQNGDMKAVLEKAINDAGSILSADNDSLTLSDEGKALAAKSEEAGSVNDESFFKLSDEDKNKIRLIQAFVYSLTGKKIKFFVPKTCKDSCKNPVAAENSNGNGPVRKGWGIDYSFNETYHEKERMSFKAAGSVETADGRKIDFNLELLMKREFLQSESFSFKAGDALIDPLVINFSSDGAKLTDVNYSFDIVANGKEEEISFVV